jgi:hypothetical protein
MQSMLMTAKAHRGNVIDPKAYHGNVIDPKAYRGNVISPIDTVVVVNVASAPHSSCPSSPSVHFLRSDPHGKARGRTEGHASLHRKLHAPRELLQSSCKPARGAPSACKDRQPQARAKTGKRRSCVCTLFVRTVRVHHHHQLLRVFATDSRALQASNQEQMLGYCALSRPTRRESSMSR